MLHNLDDLLDDSDPMPPSSAPFVIDAGGDIPDERDIPRPTPPENRTTETPYEPPLPLPFMGTQAVAGIVVDAGLLNNTSGADKTYKIGSTSRRLSVIGIVLAPATGSVFVQSSEGQIDNGCPIEAVAGGRPHFWPIKQAVLRLVTASTCGYVVIGTDVNADQ